MHDVPSGTRRRVELTDRPAFGTGRSRTAPTVPSPRLSGLSYTVVDVETTGGSPVRGDRITEIAAVVVRDGRVGEVFETLVNPERPIPIWVTRLTRISDGMVRGQPTFRELYPRVAAALAADVFVAHNAAFDWRFVSAELMAAAAGFGPSPELPPRRLCTVRLARALLPHLRRRSLDHVAHYYGVTIGARHRAAGDALATAHCLLRLLDDAGARGCDTWADVQGLLSSRRNRPPRRGHRGWYAMPRGGEWEPGA